MKRTLGFSIKLMVLVAVLAASIPVEASPADVARISDSTVKVLVERELARRNLAKTAIEVGVDDHIVTLSGTVSTLAEKKRVGETAGKSYGVSRVENNLAVEVASDEAISKAVRRSFITNPNYDTFDWIEAHVGDGVVTLSGAVREPWRKIEFENQMMSIAGVSKVENQITALPLSTYDDEIRVRLARAIYGHSAFSRLALGANPPIHIIVDNGRVTLKGIVANGMDRQIAGSLARTQSLVFDVSNELGIDSAN